ncbi:MAG: VTT domain-containing protein [Rhodospirillales bacterium]|nr:VTT domain-containing protein [Rhodospirillales bacterium]
MTAAPLPSGPKLLFRGLLLIGVLVAAGLLLREIDDGRLFNSGWIDARIRDEGPVGLALFLAAGTMFTAFGFPRQVVCFLGGYAFGFLGGTGMALTATVSGCGVAFLFARLVGRDLIGPRLPPRILAVDKFIGNHPFSLTLLIRLLPLGSNLATNLVAGLSSAALLPFLAASALGHLPQTIVFSLIGSGINVDPEARIGLGVVLFALSMLLGVKLYQRFRENGAIGAAIEAVIGNGTQAKADTPTPPATGTPRHDE